MGGMLYKDFIAVKGRRVIIILLAATLLFLALRLALPGADFTHADAGSVAFDEGIGDMFLWSFPLLVSFCLFILPTVWIKGLAAQDENSKIRAFAKSLPSGNNSHIASKYVFFAIVVYAALSLSMIWCEIYFSKAGNNGFTGLVETLRSFLIVFASVSLFVAGIELPFFLSLGSKKAVAVKTAILELAFLFVLGWLFFGNLDVFEKIDIARMVEWTKSHEFEINMMVVLCPVTASVLYYLSYKLTCAVNRNREADFDD